MLPFCINTIPTFDYCLVPTLFVFPFIKNEANQFDSCIYLSQASKKTQQKPLNGESIQDGLSIKHTNKISYIESNKHISGVNKQQQNCQSEKLLSKIQGRNIVPNVVNVILSYVRRQSKSQKVVQRIISFLGSQNIEQQTKRFYVYQNHIKNNAIDYINRRAIHKLMSYHCPNCQSFSIDQQLRLNRVFRILVRDYLFNNQLFYALGSPKMNVSKRRDNINVFRYLMKVLSVCIENQEQSLSLKL